jgi:hypothetical protein
MTGIGSVPETTFDPSLLPKQGRWLRQKFVRNWPEVANYFKQLRPYEAPIWPILVEEPKPVLKHAHPARRGLLICLGDTCVVCADRKTGFKRLDHLALDYATLETRCLATMSLQGAKKKA